MIDQKFEFAEVRIRRAISLASDIVTLRRLLHWTAWSSRYHVDPSIVEFTQETMELRSYDLIRSKLVQSVHKGLRYKLHIAEWAYCCIEAETLD